MTSMPDPQSATKPNEMVRYSKWLPSFQMGPRGQVYLDGDLTGIKQQLESMGVLFDIRDRIVTLRGKKIHQRAVYAHAGQLADLGASKHPLTHKS